MARVLRGWRRIDRDPPKVGKGVREGEKRVIHEGDPRRARRDPGRTATGVKELSTKGHEERRRATKRDGAASTARGLHPRDPAFPPPHQPSPFGSAVQAEHGLHRTPPRRGTPCGCPVIPGLGAHKGRPYGCVQDDDNDQACDSRGGSDWHLPGSRHPMTSSHQGHKIAEAFWYPLWLKQVHLSSGLFVFMRVYSCPLVVRLH